jgi:hypothetical protein
MILGDKPLISEVVLSQRGGGWVEGARPVPLMAVGSCFRRGTGTHGWDLNGGRQWSFVGEERMVERW